MVDELKIKGKIAECGITQRELARLLGMTQYTLSKKISNRAVFNASEIESACKILKIDDPMPYFFNGWLHKCNTA